MIPICFAVLLREIHWSRRNRSDSNFRRDWDREVERMQGGITISKGGTDKKHPPDSLLRITFLALFRIIFVPIYGQICPISNILAVQPENSSLLDAQDAEKRAMSNATRCPAGKGVLKHIFGRRGWAYLGLRTEREFDAFGRSVDALEPTPDHGRDPESRSSIQPCGRRVDLLHR